MMKRRHYLICSIIAMLSIVSYACETEYAICEGCGILGGDGNKPDDTVDNAGNGASENVCTGNQRCAEGLNGKQVCSDGKWGNIGECMSCFNKNTDNSGTDSLICNGCTPNLYDESGKEVCYKGAFIKVESKELSENDEESMVVVNPDLDTKDALWELAFKISTTGLGSWSYYNCYDSGVLSDIQKNKSINTSSRVQSCCEDEDYYIKRTGYKYYSIEKCVKVEAEGVSADFMAYEYTGELNDSLIGQKQKLPYGFCHEENLFLAVNDNDAKSVYHRYECESGSKCSDNFNGLCIINGVPIDGNKAFECEIDLNSTKKTPFVIKSGDDIIATCPTKTVLKIKDDNGKWSNVICGSQTFTLDKVRCAPIELSSGKLTPIPKS